MPSPVTADVRRVHEQLEAQLDPALLARKPGLGEARRPPRGRREPLVAPASGAARRDDRARALVRQICEELALLVEDLRPDGHLQLQVAAVGAVPVGAAAVLASAGAQPPPAGEARQVSQRADRSQRDVAARSAVTAVPAAARPVLLAPQAP